MKHDILHKEIRGAYSTLRPFREVFRALVKEFGGEAYASNYSTASRPQYLNLLQQAIETWLITIIPNMPRVQITSHYNHIQWFAKQYEIALNNLLTQIGFQKTSHKWLLDGLFGIGIMKIHMADSGDTVEEGDVRMDPGMPFASKISLDNFAYDTGANDWANCQWLADMYQISYDEMMANDYYDQKVIKELDLQPSKSAGDPERAEYISTGDKNTRYRDMVDLCDVFIVHESMIYTYAVEDRYGMSLTGKPIAKMPWTGSESGPYKILTMIDVPDNTMPSSMAENVAGLSRFCNNLFRKQVNQARRQKTFHIYGNRDEANATRMKRADDGEWVKVADPQEINTVRHGGPDADNQQMLLQGIQLFDRMGGNISSMAGLGPQADTAKQEQIISEAASKKETFMQQRVISALQEACRDLGLLLWEDEYKTIPATKPYSDEDPTPVDASWLPNERFGNFIDFNFTIDVYSMVYRTPATRMRGIQEYVNTVMQMYPIIQEQGGTINVRELTRMYSEMMSEPRLLNLLTFNGRPVEQNIPGSNAQQAKPGQLAPQKPNGQYQRTNVTTNDPLKPNIANTPRPRTEETAA